jgi:hypothetical protein
VPFVPASSVVQITAEQQYGSQPLANVFCVQFTTPPSAVGMGDTLDLVSAWFSTTYAPLCHTGWSLTGLRARDLSTQDGIVVETAPSGVVGQLSGTPLPSSIAMCLSLRSALAGRSRRGRIYLSGLTAVHLENTNQNLFSSAAITARINAVETLRSDLDTGGTDWVIVSRFSLGVERVTALVTPVTSIISTDPTVDSQRGRTRS